MQILVGIQCPGSTWKIYLLHRLEKSRCLIFLNNFKGLLMLTVDRRIIERSTE